MSKQPATQASLAPPRKPPAPPILSTVNEPDEPTPLPGSLAELRSKIKQCQHMLDNTPASRTRDKLVTLLATLIAQAQGMEQAVAQATQEPPRNGPS